MLPDFLVEIPLGGSGGNTREQIRVLPLNIP
jgi:hypothetical protein